MTSVRMATPGRKIRRSAYNKQCRSCHELNHEPFCISVLFWSTSVIIVLEATYAPNEQTTTLTQESLSSSDRRE